MLCSSHRIWRSGCKARDEDWLIKACQHHLRHPHPPGVTKKPRGLALQLVSSDLRQGKTPNVKLHSILQARLPQNRVVPRGTPPMPPS